MDQGVLAEQAEPEGRETDDPENAEGAAESAAPEQPNPFWSDRAAEEFRLRQARPLGLAEYDDRQLEPDYAASDAARSGYRSLEAASVREQSPPTQGAELRQAGTSQGRVSSSVPSVSSRSRSPVRDDYVSMRELLASFGGAIASLAEEQRNTQQRLARVEEARSGSGSSMRTGREDNDSTHASAGDLGVGPLYYQIGEDDREEPRSLRSGALPLEDWVQEPVRLSDLPEEQLSVPLENPQSYGPEYVLGSGNMELEPSRDMGIATVASAQVGARQGPAKSDRIALGQSAFGTGVSGFEVSTRAAAGDARFGPGNRGHSAFGPGVSGFEVSTRATAGDARFGPGNRRHSAQVSQVSRRRPVLPQVMQGLAQVIKVNRHSAQVSQVSRRQPRLLQVMQGLAQVIKVNRHSAQVSQVSRYNYTR